MSLTDHLAHQNGSGGIPDDTVLRLSRRKHVVDVARDRRILQGTPNNGHSTTPPHPKKGYLTDFEHRRRTRSHVYSEIEQGVSEYFVEHGNGNKLYQLLGREAPGLLESHPLRLVFELINQYGIDAVIEGYQASQATGFPFVAEVVASSNEVEPIPINHGIDSDVKWLMDREAERGLDPKSQFYRRSPTTSTHFHEHQAEQALERMV